MASHAQQDSETSENFNAYHTLLRKLQRQANYDAIHSQQQTRDDRNFLMKSLGGSDDNLKSSRGEVEEVKVDLGVKATGAGVIKQPPPLEDEDEDIRVFGNDPSPATLRLLIDDVRTAVESKLQVASVSSLKEAMRNIFTSRGLLDKLLKDIPNHEYVRENHPDVKVHEYFSEFRRAPIILPTASYKTDPETGRVVPELTSVAIPGNTPRKSIAAAGQLMKRMSVAPPGTLQSVATSPGMPGAEQMAPLLSAEAFKAPSSSSAVVSGVDGPGGSSTQQQSMTPTKPRLGPRAPPNVSARAMHKSTLIDTSAQTDDVSFGREDGGDKPARGAARRIQALENRVRILETDIRQYENVIHTLDHQLDVLKGVLSSRTTAVQHLRSTLHKECCTLRTQLAVQKYGSDKTATDVNSFLDLVLLAVESEKRLSDSDSLSGGPTPQELVERLKMELRDKRQAWKKEHAQMTMKFNSVVAEKNKQIALIKGAVDVGKIQARLLDGLADVKQAHGELSTTVKKNLDSTQKEIRHAATEVGELLRRFSQESAVLKQNKGVTKTMQDMMRAVLDLITPMLLPEYGMARSHPWEAMERAPEPLTSYMSDKYGSDACSLILGDLEIAHKLYDRVKVYMMKLYQRPTRGNPQTGSMLSHLCRTMLAAKGLPSTDAATVRNCMDLEHLIRSQLARLHFSLKALSQVKRARVERSAEAVKLSGRSAKPLPMTQFHESIDRRMHLLHEKKHVLEQKRKENAAKLYAIWSETDIVVGAVTDFGYLAPHQRQGIEELDVENVSFGESPSGNVFFRAPAADPGNDSILSHSEAADEHAKHVKKGKRLSALHAKPPDGATAGSRRRLSTRRAPPLKPDP